ncbi:zinc ribbon domain-containing protein, partial [Caldivirga sp.]|uniref:zinc ribbon domain-containing protein n=1 Tax=Caldivirga sp. TaxID=2080243 RepID=UPI003D114AA8
GYRRLAYWLDWEAQKHGVPVKVVNPRGTSTKCPICGLEEDRDVIAVINLSKMGGTLPTPTAHPMTTRARAGTNEPSLRPEKANEETERRSAMGT